MYCIISRVSTKCRTVSRVLSTMQVIMCFADTKKIYNNQGLGKGYQPQPQP